MLLRKKEDKDMNRLISVNIAAITTERSATIIMENIISILMDANNVHCS
jgi:hypothetical protein